MARESPKKSFWQAGSSLDRLLGLFSLAATAMSLDSRLYWIGVAIFAIVIIITFNLHSQDARRFHKKYRSARAEKPKLPHELLFALGLIAFCTAVPVALFFASDPPSSDYYVTDWGQTPGQLEQFTRGDVGSYKGTAQSHIVVNGNLVRKAIGTSYRLVGVAYHHFRSGDPQDEPNVSRSGPYDIIDGSVYIVVPWNEVFLTERVSGMTGTTYELIALPIDKAAQKFSTIRQAVAFGAKRLAGRVGPP